LRGWGLWERKGVTKVLAKAESSIFMRVKEKLDTHAILTFLITHSAVLKSLPEKALCDRIVKLGKWGVNSSLG
jgi:hypothetical protein